MSSEDANGEDADAEDADGEGADGEDAEDAATAAWFRGSPTPRATSRSSVTATNATCPEIPEEPDEQCYGAAITTAETIITLQPRSGTTGTKHGTGTICLRATYEHVRGTPDGGNVTGPGYVAIDGAHTHLLPPAGYTLVQYLS